VQRKSARARETRVSVLHASPWIDNIPLRRDVARKSGNAWIRIADQNHISFRNALRECIARRDSGPEGHVCRFTRLRHRTNDDNLDRASLQPSHEIPALRSTQSSSAGTILPIISPSMTVEEIMTRWKRQCSRHRSTAPRSLYACSIHELDKAPCKCRCGVETIMIEASVSTAF
jgi:hypothetical protein